MIEGHGDDLYRYGGAVKHNFSTNIKGDMDHTQLREFLASVLWKIRSYPEPAPFTLERRIARRTRLKAENIVVTNGATDAMYRIAHIMRGRRSVIVSPTFIEYESACRAHDHEITFVSGIGMIPAEVDCIWICNPNNPTGLVTDKKLILKMAAEHPEAIVVVDQAYADYTKKAMLKPTEAVKSGNIVLLSSLTKRYCVPGLRIGYVTAPEEIAGRIRSEGMPWSVNTLAIEAAGYLMDYDSNYVINVHEMNYDIRRMAKYLRKMEIECTESDCNFMLCRVPFGTAAELKRYLVDYHGILIRDASNFEGLDETYFRVATQGVDADYQLIKGVKKWIGRKRKSLAM